MILQVMMINYGIEHTALAISYYSNICSVIVFHLIPHVPLS